MVLRGMPCQRLCTFVVLIACLICLSRAQKPELSYCSPDLNAGIFTPSKIPPQFAQQR